MAQLVMQAMRELGDLGDQRVESWPFMGSVFIPISINIVYLLTVLKIAPAFMKNRAAFTLKKIIVFYNIVQIICCLTMFFALLFNGWLDGLYPLTCVDNDYSNDPKAVRFAHLFWWNLVIKLLDLTETVFFVLRKKQNQVSFLHLYHHISTFSLMWIATKYISGIMVSMLIMINSLVHVLMYLYYLISLLGPEVQQRIQKYKRLLTILQMIQFTIVLIYTGQLFMPHCQHLPSTRNLIYIFFPNVIIIFYLFYDFFRKAYVKRKNK